MPNNGWYHGDATLNVGRPRHMSEDEAQEMVAARYGREEITDECAVTIASWWATSARGRGLGMAELSTSGRVRLEDLADDLSDAYNNVTPTSLNVVEDTQALDMLATWALNHPSRKSAPHEQTWACCTSSIGPVCQHKREE